MTTSKIRQPCSHHLKTDYYYYYYMYWTIYLLTSPSGDYYVGATKYTADIACAEYTKLHYRPTTLLMCKESQVAMYVAEMSRKYRAGSIPRIVAPTTCNISYSEESLYGVKSVNITVPSRLLETNAIRDPLEHKIVSVAASIMEKAVTSNNINSELTINHRDSSVRIINRIK